MNDCGIINWVISDHLIPGIHHKRPRQNVWLAARLFREKVPFVLEVFQSFCLRGSFMKFTQTNDIGIKSYLDVLFQTSQTFIELGITGKQEKNQQNLLKNG